MSQKGDKISDHWVLDIKFSSLLTGMQPITQLSSMPMQGAMNKPPGPCLDSTKTNFQCISKSLAPARSLLSPSMA